MPGACGARQDQTSGLDMVHDSRGRLVKGLRTELYESCTEPRNRSQGVGLGKARRENEKRRAVQALVQAACPALPHWKMMQTTLLINIKFSVTQSLTITILMAFVYMCKMSHVTNPSKVKFSFIQRTVTDWGGFLC